MKIKNLVLLSLLSLVSLEITSSSGNLVYTGSKNPNAAMAWARQGATPAEKAARAQAVLNSGVVTSSDTSKYDELERFISAGSSIPAEKIKTPEELAAEAKKAADKAAADKLKEEEEADRLKKEEADRLEKEATKQAAEAKAAQDAADKKAQDAADAAAKASREEAEAAAAKAAAEAAKAGEDKTAQDAAAKAAAAESKKTEALQLVQDIATKVNATDYSGNLKAALHDKAPVAAGAHRSKTLGRLGKDKVQKHSKKAKTTKRNQYA